MTNTTDYANSRQTAALAHVLDIVTGFVAPLIIFLVKKDDRFVRERGAGVSLPRRRATRVVAGVTAPPRHSPRRTTPRARATE